ncbi:DUF86 domain-containing protein [Sulfurimonas sp. ST-27]|uniref:HepT-like ribonuclease domain-containing protein n=1 Tax=Sulfurimonas sp. ST-27 TaxID=3400152 RepID=UPI003AB39CB2
MKRNYKLFLEDISERIEKINKYTHNMTYEEFIQDDKTVSACIREIEVIGEATKQIPQEITEQFTQLPWSLMAKMRDKLIHWYFEIDEEIVWNVTKNKLPNIKIEIDKIIKTI